MTLPLVVCLTVLFPLASMFLARPIAARTDPRWGTWLLTGAAVALAACSGLALTLVTFAALVRVPFVAALGRWSPAVIDRGDTTSAVLAIVTGLLLGMALTAAARFALRRGRALAEAFRHARGLPGRGQVVVTSDAAADAYTVPGRPGRIVVSTGMLDSLDDVGRVALLAHERAHLSGQHYAFTSAARLAAATNPLLRPLAEAVEFTVERWADECAARVVGDRRLVAETIARAAVAAKHGGRRRWSAAMLGAVFPRPDGGPGPVPRRVAALLAPPPRRRWILQAAVVAIALAAGVLAVEAARDMHELLETARYPR
ncbi:M48 family metalloprotease [Actinocrinis puniceicyclus]|uniref:M48 family metalloprotease n=1 Tax=Actinocrinis puniceicyclus TaxID=977794 RepID=A0A8J7WQ64_9ACTN|nr:M56 family metallopeptidase [Actinocrinis puniceicyclus]MBS2963510.1 M48 family metalloprotease [Actinocrinis puniceicyclus]